jgi:universal stress protein A
MSGYKNLLIMSDLSNSSVILCEKAAVLAKALNAKMNIIHIVEYLPQMYSGGEFALPLDPQIEDELAQDAKNNLESQGKHHNIPKQNQFVIIGEITEEIEKMVEKNNIDLVIVGTHDRHGLDYILGTTADNVLHTLHCDVLAIYI